MKSGNHNFLEPSGPFQTYNGTAFLPYLSKILILYIVAFGWNEVVLRKVVSKLLIRS